ncbi:P-loop containing nucleoside triphosphate hydrolase protein [Chytriomyces cf. hyalinus JEL632]|nr:P-loop containing nucleoside triphosphate hydrolase protein [Chytriomyces cf. hyalinus JEL632]
MRRKRGHSDDESGGDTATASAMRVKRVRNIPVTIPSPAVPCNTAVYVISDTDSNSDSGSDVLEVRQVGTSKKTPTKEQAAIIDYGKKLSIRDLGQVVRIVAGAGTGKTTTLHLLAEELVKASHSILYIVYNKVAQKDAEERFHSIGSKVQCRTMHGAALHYLQRPTADFDISPVDDSVVQQKIEAEYMIRVSTWMRERYAGSGDQRSNAGSRQAGNERSQFEKAHLVRVKLALFYVFKTLEFWYRSTRTREELTENDFWTYYPAKLKHKDDWNFRHEKFYVNLAGEIWDRMWTGGFPINHDSYLKYAQLGYMQLPSHITTILMDESQDSSACQLDLFVTQLAKSPTKPRNVFIVGDAAQSIYYFRGARPKELAQIHEKFERGPFKAVADFRLTQSFRFGPNVARVANTLLYIKANSPQAKDFNPYILVGGSPIDGELVSEDETLPFPYTIIARSRLQLIMKGLLVLAEFRRQQLTQADQIIDVDEIPSTYDTSVLPTPQRRRIKNRMKIALNGNVGEYKKSIKDALDIFQLFLNKRPKMDKFKEYESFDDFEKDVSDRELGEYKLIVMLVNEYKEELPGVLAEFEKEILEKAFKLTEADVILSTAHQSKGLEYDHVEVCDDFLTLDVQEKPRQQSQTWKKASQAVDPNKMEMEFNLKAWGDDLNLWYVAVTRPKKILKLPAKWWGIHEYMTNFLTTVPLPADVESKAGEPFGELVLTNLDGSKQLNVQQEVALRELFSKLAPFLDGQF